MHDQGATPMRGSTSGTEGDSLPARRTTLVDRFRVMQWIRLGATTFVALCVVLAPDTLRPHAAALVPLTMGFLLVAGVAELVVNRWPEHILCPLRGMIVIDAAWVTSAAYLAGGVTSPLHYVIVLHLAAVTLLASYRTGLVLALVDTVLLIGTRMAIGAGALAETAPRLPASPGQQLTVFLVMLWIVALATSTLWVLNERELLRRRRDLEALALLTERVERSVAPSDVARTLLDALVSSYGLRRGVVLGSPSGKLRLLGSYGLPTDVKDRGTSAVVDAAHRQGGTLLVRRLDPEADPWLVEMFPDAGSLLVVPLLADARPIGALVVEHTARERHQRRMVSALERSVAYGSLALRNAWLMESVQRLAATDGLTKIANRRAFEYTLERELARATRSAEYVALVMVDIDHFKALNDTLGHLAGDEVLRNVAAALACECREFDTPARYGGEEFAVILPGCQPDQAYEIAERLRRAVCTAPAAVPVTASAGVAVFPAHAGDADGLVRAADEALYASKHAGRDRASVSAGLAPDDHVDALLRRAVRDRLRAREGRTEDEALLRLFDT